jgi:hypothetical protein
MALKPQLLHIAEFLINSEQSSSLGPGESANKVSAALFMWFPKVPEKHLFLTKFRAPSKKARDAY